MVCELNEQCSGIEIIRQCIVLSRSAFIKIKIMLSNWKLNRRGLRCYIISVLLNELESWTISDVTKKILFWDVVVWWTKMNEHNQKQKVIHENKEGRWGIGLMFQLNNLRYLRNTIYTSQTSKQASKFVFLNIDYLMVFNYLVPT